MSVKGARWTPHKVLFYVQKAFQPERQCFLMIGGGPFMGKVKGSMDRKPL